MVHCQLLSFSLSNMPHQAQESGGSGGAMPPPSGNRPVRRSWSAIDAPPRTGAASSAASVAADAAASQTNGDVRSAVHETEVAAALNSYRGTRAHGYDMDRLERHEEDTAVSGLSVYEDCLREKLCKAVFVGHVNTDLDSVAGAIGAAHLFGGRAALAEPLNELNGEILFAIKNSGVEPPPHFDELEDARDCDLCLVDHTEEKQMVPSIRASPRLYDRIVGVVDHHALAKSFQTVRPIYMDVRPWGSMSTIVGYLFVANRRGLPKPIAVLLLQAILSDTLNLRSVTTTDADRGMVALLASYAGLGRLGQTVSASAAKQQGRRGLYDEADIDLLAKKQFQAKTNWVTGLGAFEMVRGDQKDFSCGPWKFSISVLEVTDTAAVMKIAKELLMELRLLKKEKALVDIEGGEGEGGKTLDRTLELDFAFLFVVNVVEETSILLICGGRELALARATFLENDEINVDGTAVRLQEAVPGIDPPGRTIQPHETAMVLPKGYVSRKAQFVPAFFRAIRDDFEQQEGRAPASQRETDAEEDRVSELQEKLNVSKNAQKPKRHRSSLIQSFRSNAMNMLILQEDLAAEELQKANALQQKRRHGNLYDDFGRVMRMYAIPEK